LLAALANLDPPDDIRVYLNAAEQPAGLRLPGTPVPIPGPRFWTLRNLAVEMQRHPPELLFVPSHVIPPIHPRTVVTIHDLGYLVEPSAHEPIHRTQLDWTTRWNVRAAAGIIAVSQSTKRDLIELLDAPPGHIQVIYHGISNDFTPASNQQVSTIRTRYGLGNRTILAVGSIHPRKNLTRLIQAFEQLAANDEDLQLVLCGSVGWRGDQIVDRAATSPFGTRIRLLGYVSDSDMPSLYSAASVLAFPSLYEGFGLPALESMACGTPVVAADRTALPEICGNAAVLVDPFDSMSIAAGIRQILTDQNLRNGLIERGHQRAKQFNWHTSARQTLAFLRSIRDN
jgi:glycosyltransferase involved in cell wall biosynthesis